MSASSTSEGDRAMPRRTTGTPTSTNGHGPTDGDAPVLGFIEPIEIQEEMERSFLEYSMSVIVSRALPDVRDGLKPVHRRILYSMFDQNLLPDPPPREMRGGGRRGHGDLPPPRRLGHLRRPGTDGPGLQPAPPTGRRARQLRRARPRRGAGGHALHRVPAAGAGAGPDGGDRRGDGRLRAATTPTAPSSRRCCRPASPTCW